MSFCSQKVDYFAYVNPDLSIHCDLFRHQNEQVVSFYVSNVQHATYSFVRVYYVRGNVFV